MEKKETKRKRKKYEVIVEMKDPFVLENNKKIAELIKGKIKGTAYSTTVTAVGGICSDNFKLFIRPLFLSRKYDFKPFAEALMTIDGVIAVTKGDGGADWKKTESEKKKEEAEENKRIEAMEKKIREDLEKKRQGLKEVAELKKKAELSDRETYGPPGETSKLDWQEFENFLGSIGECEVEAVALFFNPIGCDFIEQKRETAKTSGDKVISFFTYQLNNNLSLPSNGKVSFYELPLSVEYREKDGKKFARIITGSGGTSLSAVVYELSIRT